MNKKMYRADFVEWLLDNATIDIDEEDDYLPKWVIGVETHVIEFFTTEQAYDYWIENK